MAMSSWKTSTAPTARSSTVNGCTAAASCSTVTSCRSGTRSWRPTDAEDALMPASLRWGAASHPGQVRMNNEDAYAADDGMWVVADGMGGHLAGEVASAYTIDALRAANRVGITSSSDMVDAVQQAN